MLNILSYLFKIKLLFRKISLPIKREHIVIDVGSGGNPHYMSDVTTDMSDESTDRFETLKFKGLFVWSNAEYLPFKSKIFDFSVSSHVLEHTPYPEKMIVELSRISKAGYIETPPAWMELVSPYKMHYSRVTIKDDKLFFSMKNQYDETLPHEWQDLIYSIKAIQNNNRIIPSMISVNYFLWQNNIKYEIIRHKDYVPFKIELESNEDVENSKFKDVFYEVLRFLSFRKKKLSESAILCCPKCKSDLSFSETEAKCNDKACNHIYIKYKGYWDFRI